MLIGALPWGLGWEISPLPKSHKQTVGGEVPRGNPGYLNKGEWFPGDQKNKAHYS